MVCPTCGKSWPSRGGVPRFFEPSYYWGEIPESEANSLIEEAKQQDWRKAVVDRFAGNQAMQTSLLDWQRASWLPLLGLESDAVALDIGSGYGAITHALARSVGNVCSLEAISQRIEFTKVRLEQENIHNVQLLQGSALELPFFDQTFDLIVINGVLEWVGEWQTDKDPRAVQVEFLQRVSRLLKDQGVIVIGIENRLSYETLLGAIDHSGLPYTNWMPRFAATYWLRRLRSHRYRTSANKTDYRTYTYSERGYERLLADGGLSAQYYWSYPGYNEPYSLVPLVSELIEDQIVSGSTEPSQAKRRTWRSEVAGMLARLGVLRFLVPEFLIVAGKNTDSFVMPNRRFWKAMECALPSKSDLEHPLFMLSTDAFRKKSVMRIFDQKDRALRVVVKTAEISNGSPIQKEFANLTLVTSRLQHASRPGFNVPGPLASFQVGNFIYSAELPASGEQFSRLLFSNPQSRWLPFLSKELPRSIGIAVMLAGTLKGERSVDQVDPRWWRLPSIVEADTNIDLLREQSSASQDSEFLDCVQHGDYTVENLFLDRQTGQTLVIDWEHLVRGVPPLYDIFTLLISLLHAVVTGDTSWPPGDSAETQFRGAFFGTGPFAQLFREMILSACDGLAIAQADVWKMFLQSLVLRRNHHASRGSWSMAETELRYFQLANEHRKEFIVAR
jgi:ubiquinone/menaquinone biosynthesis C-methylase UbiE